MRRFDWSKALCLLNKGVNVRQNPPPSLLHSSFSKSFSNNKVFPFADKQPSILVKYKIPILSFLTPLQKNEKPIDPHYPIHLTSKAQKLKAIEEGIRKLNLQVLRRELLNDCVQLPLKYFAWKWAPLHK